MPDITETTVCSCSCGCQTYIVLYRPQCTFCFWNWHHGDERRFHGAIVTNGLSVKALRKAHASQLVAVRQIS